MQNDSPVQDDDYWQGNGLGQLIVADPQEPGSHDNFINGVPGSYDVFIFENGNVTDGIYFNNPDGHTGQILWQGETMPVPDFMNNVLENYGLGAWGSNDGGIAEASDSYWRDLLFASTYDEVTPDFMSEGIY